MWNNSVKLIGRITKNPELKGSALKFTVACNRPKQEGKEESADFVPCTTFGRLSDIVSTFQKGDEIYAEGTFRTGSYQNQSGQTVYTNEVLCSIVKRFGQPQNAVNHQNNGTQQGFNQNTNKYSSQQENAVKNENTAYYGNTNIADDDLPF